MKITTVTFVEVRVKFVCRMLGLQEYVSTCFWSSLGPGLRRRLATQIAEALDLGYGQFTLGEEVTLSGDGQHYSVLGTAGIPVFGEEEPTLDYAERWLQGILYDAGEVPGHFELLGWVE